VLRYAIFTLKSILLFPIRLPVALFWGIWNMTIGGLYVGCAPKFWAGDRYVLFQKRYKGKYCIIRLEISSKNREVLLTSKHPIEHFVVFGNTLVAYAYHKEKWACTVIDLESQSQKITELSVRSRYGDVFLPNTVGLLAIERICAKEFCFNQLVRIDEFASELLENHIDSFVVDTAMSPDGKYFAYTTTTGIKIIDSISAKEISYPGKQLRIFNFNIRNQLLATDSINKRLLVFTPPEEHPEFIELPPGHRSKALWKAAISPSGEMIVYQLLGKMPGVQGDSPILLYTTTTENHKIIANKVRIFGISWAESEKYLAFAGINRRDIFDIVYGYTMRNATNNDKDVIDTNGNLIAQL
jgi:WD40 repeat protein